MPVNSCRGGRHVYEEVAGAAGLSRRKCRQCGSVQIDLVGPAAGERAGAAFAPRRPTLFSLRNEAVEQARSRDFGKRRAGR